MVNSNSSAASFMPAVSTSQKSWPFQLALAVTLSRVVPASCATMASRRPKIALNKLDLPTLARPTMATIGTFCALITNSITDERLLTKYFHYNIILPKEILMPGLLVPVPSAETLPPGVDQATATLG